MTNSAAATAGFITPGMDDPAPPTLQRWLAGERIGPLPVRGAERPPPLLSFEFFPPKTEALEQQLWACIRRLAPLQPRFVSVTYGAGGSTHARTHATVARLARETAIVPAAHLTCIGATRTEVDTSRAATGRPGCGTSWRYAAIRRRGRHMRPIPAAMPSPAISWPGCGGSQISRSPSPHIPRRTRRR